MDYRRLIDSEIEKLEREIARLKDKREKLAQSGLLDAKEEDVSFMMDLRRKNG